MHFLQQEGIFMCAERSLELMVRESEARSRQQLAEIEAIYANVPVGLCVVDSDLRFVRINERLAEINGMSIAQHLGRTVREVLPNLVEELEPLFRSVLETGRPIFQREVCGTTPAQPGVERNWIADYGPLKEGDKVIAVNAVVIEVTEQRRTQKALQMSEERLRIALEGNSEGVWDWDIRKGPAVFNAGYSRMLGYEPEEFARDYDSWRALVHPDDIAGVDRAHSEHIYENKKFRVELRMRKKNGDWCWILSRGAVVERDREGHALRMIGTHMDITEIKLAEAEKARLQEQLLQAQKLESVGRLAGGIAHDFNNMLSVINGYGDLLLRELAQDDPHREIISEIRAVGRRAANLTRQLLAFSRKQILHPQPVIIDATIHDMQHMIARLLGEDVQVIMLLNAGDAAVFIDPGQFDQILMNLVVNARDAMPGGGTLSIETKKQDMHEPGPTADPPRAWVEIIVRDTGIGMDEVTRNHLFEPYFTTKEIGKGSGLGLSTIHGIIAQSGGSVQVESATGAGTTFRIFLPKMEGPISPPKTIEEAVNLYGTETVLVVEDEAEVRAYTVAALKAYGYRAVTAENAQNALKVAERKRESIDLVLTDVVMPGMSGRDLVAKLSQRWPALRALYMSGYSSEIIAHHGILEKDFILVEKPFSPEQLAQKVREVLGPAKSLNRVLVLGDSELRSLLCPVLGSGGYEVIEAADNRQLEETGKANPVDLIITELAAEERQAVKTVSKLRELMPGVAIIVILEATGGRFLEMEKLVAADAAITKPINTGFLLKRTREVLEVEKTKGNS
jgi:two-component system, cell cycle sensor histidine kinase and response regulator CckA